jgi:hypothetical protein
MLEIGFPVVPTCAAEKVHKALRGNVPGIAAIPDAQRLDYFVSAEIECQRERSLDL